MSKICIAIRHIPIEDLGSLAEPIESGGFEIRYIEAPIATKAEFRLARSADLLIVLGGPIGAYDDVLYPFLKDEQELLQERLSTGKPILGICLGAQLMAKALGSNVYPSERQEIGWFPIDRDPSLPTNSPFESLFGGMPSIMMFHWHGDTFDLPNGATRIASSEKTIEQGFTVGSHAVALQFHPEITVEALELWLVAHAHEISSSEEGAKTLIENLRHGAKAYGDELRKRGQAFMKDWLGSFPRFN